MIKVKGSGGGVNIKGATATPEDVRSGKTFFAGESREMQAGELLASGMLKCARGSVAIPSAGASTTLTFPFVVDFAMVYLNNSNNYGVGFDLEGGYATGDTYSVHSWVTSSVPWYFTCDITSSSTVTVYTSSSWTGSIAGSLYYIVFGCPE